MLIKFVEPDPRAGTVARMDSSRGQQLIDAGAAVLAAEDTAAAPATPALGAPQNAPAKAARQPKNPHKTPPVHKPAAPEGADPVLTTEAAPPAQDQDHAGPDADTTR